MERDLSAAEIEFNVIVTTDQNIRHQQNLAGRRRLAILVLPTTNWRIIRIHQQQIAAAINRLRPGDIIELKFEIPDS